MDMSAVSGALAGLNSSVQVLKQMLELKVSSTVTEKTIELQRHLMGVNAFLIQAQETIAALNQQKVEIEGKLKEVEDELARIKGFVAEEGRYERRAIGPGAFVFMAKEVEGPDETAPWYCDHCFGEKKQSVLQLKGFTFGAKIFACPRCKSEVRLPNPDVAVAMVSSTRPRDGFEDY